MNKTNFLPYIHMSREVPLDELNQYISIEFENWIWDPERAGDDDNKTLHKVLPSRLCVLEDFPEDSDFGEVLEEDIKDGV